MANVYIFSAFISGTRACTACSEQDWEVCAPKSEGWWHAKGGVHAA